jgi:hypothetical protein
LFSYYFSVIEGASRKGNLMGYLAIWEQLKKDFEKTTGNARPKETTKKVLLGTVQKASGISPILKDVDSALQKQERTPLEQSLNKLFAARGAYVTFLNQEQKQFLNDPADPELIVWKAYHALIFGLQKIETDAAGDAKKLQAKKSPGKVSIEWLSLEGDLKGTITTAKNDLSKFSSLEKKHNILKKADLTLKDTEKYTKAAARTEYKDAREALLSFQTDAKKCAGDLKTILSAEKSDANFTKALQKFHDAMAALASSARVAAQINNLKAAEQGASAS